MFFRLGRFSLTDFASIDYPVFVQKGAPAAGHNFYTEKTAR
jgi:hypothetical protein